MPYLTSYLWKLPKFTSAQPAQSDPNTESDAPCLLAAACRDCGNYNFPPKSNCRYCGSPRIRTVSVGPESPVKTRKWAFSPPDCPQKPN
ncbi:zinc ribbon domain-containing protein [Bradymonas sediminis]|uniref:ChsH2 rubredoxin-like zinc ribbon domain-containing protein n=1 Tax=Bradymonas sediminis TaxID=1548548 RepID=A0A2Z4FN23_9DELT|nr:zinc ribbon domain-containing protein [Bradymonas sediminis]AWV90391.1 hypothetical protein DN745_14055 [Bradymonas sediminis]TDP72224.1 rubredoxin-like zinc ribbon protein [Bradymonas sediminis]